MISVLLVEDHPIVSRTIARFLRKHQIDVWSAVASAETALEQLQEASETGEPLPDLALVDISLPAMSGIEFLSVVAKQHPDLPCLMVSGRRERYIMRRSRAKGARGYVAKGDPPALLEGVRRVANGELFFEKELE